MLIRPFQPLAAHTVRQSEQWYPAELCANKLISLIHLIGDQAPISVRPVRASATETVDCSLFTGWVNQRPKKIGIHSFPA